MHTTEEIIFFITKVTGKKSEPNSDIFFDLGVYGDDFHELIEKFASEYSVDMTNYLWYFHADEEGQSLGGLFFKPPYKVVDRIPITPTLLTEIANYGKWNIHYPDHKIPERRYDILINRIFIGIVLVCIIGLALSKCSK